MDNSSLNTIHRLVQAAASLSLNDLAQLQTELEKLRIHKIRSQQLRQQQQQQQHSSQHLNSRPQTTLSRATDIFDPIDRQVAIPIDWGTFDSRAISSGNTPQSDPATWNTPGAVSSGLRSTSSLIPTDFIPGARGTSHTRIGRKSNNPDPKFSNIDSKFSNPDVGFDANPDYYNPYECGPKQSSLPAQVLRPHTGPYDCDAELLARMGINSQAPNQIPSHIRNINVESSLIQREATKLPGQRTSTDREVDRFETLPFDPQNTRHIIWADSMPRGGYSTRNDRLEYE